MAWSIDRLTRKGCWSRDTVELLRGIQEAGIVLFTLEEDYDTTTARWKRRLADHLSRAEEESEAVEGGQGGGGARRHEGRRAPAVRVRTVTDVGGAKVVELVPAEADMVCQAANRVLEGRLLRLTVLDWNRLGLRPRRAGRGASNAVAACSCSPGWWGVHRGEVIRRDVFPSGARPPGVRGGAGHPGRRRPAPDPTVLSYVLTEIARCSACVARMRSNQAAGGPWRYALPAQARGMRRPHNRGRAPLEDLVADAVLIAPEEGLNAALAESAEGAAEAIEAGAEMREAELRLEDLSREWARGRDQQTRVADHAGGDPGPIDAARTGMPEPGAGHRWRSAGLGSPCQQSARGASASGPQRPCAGGGYGRLRAALDHLGCGRAGGDLAGHPRTPLRPRPGRDRLARLGWSGL